MTTMTEPRAFEMTIDLDASPEDVWRALTEAGELVRWFPLDAKVTPGKGGSMHWSWGDAWAWGTRIAEWQPGRRLKLVQDEFRPYDATGHALPGAKLERVALALEFTLETHAGKTRLRFVHSGFGRGDAWDDEFDGISLGWPMELRSLRHYLGRHRGRDRHVGRALVATSESRDAAWARLTGAFRVTPMPPTPGRPYTLEAATGDRFTGTLELYQPGRTMWGTVAELDDGVFRMSTHRAGGQTGVEVWVASYMPDASRVKAFETKAREVMGRLFPA